MYPKMGYKWGTKEGAEVNLIVKNRDIGFLCASNEAQKLCASSAPKWGTNGAQNGVQMGYTMGYNGGSRGELVS